MKLGDEGFFLEVYFCPCMMCNQVFEGSYFVVLSSSNEGICLSANGDKNFKTAQGAFDFALNWIEMEA